MTFIKVTHVKTTRVNVIIANSNSTFSSQQVIYVYSYTSNSYHGDQLSTDTNDSE